MLEAPILPAYLYGLWGPPDTQMRLSELWDARLARRYSGPDDPRFICDTLLERCEVERAEAAISSWEGTWDRLCNEMRLHPDSTTKDVAQRAAALLQQRQARSREMYLIAELMGRDRHSLKQAGLTPAEAVEQAFADQWRELERLRAQAQEAADPYSLVALGDADSLAEKLAGGAPLHPAGRLHDGDEGGADSDGSWTTASGSEEAEAEDTAPQGSARRSAAAAQAGSGGDVGRSDGGSGGGGSGDRSSEDGSSGGGGGNNRNLRGLMARMRRLGRDSSEADGEEGGEDRTPLHLAAYLSHIDCIKVLVQAAEVRGCRQECLDAGDRHGGTALHRAVRSGTAETIQLLLELGASPNLADHFLRTPVHKAARSAAVERELWRLQALLDGATGLKLDEADGDGQTALHTMVERGELECVQMLLDAGAGASVPDRFGNTPLHIACSDGDMDMAELLLACGADVRACDDEGRTPADVAEAMGNEELADLLHSRTLLRRLDTFTRSDSQSRREGDSAATATAIEEELPEGQACVICLTRPKVVILAPCGHRCACKRCMRAMMVGPRDKRKCPICTEQIESFVTKVYD